MTEKEINNVGVTMNSSGKSKNELEWNDVVKVPENGENEDDSSTAKLAVPSNFDNDNVENRISDEIEELKDASRNLEIFNESLPDLHENFSEDILSSSEENIKTSDSEHEKEKLSPAFNWCKEVKVFDEKELLLRLNELTDYELKMLLQETQEINANVFIENDVYEFILHEDEIVRNTLEMVEIDQEPSLQDSTLALSYAEKWFFARKKLEQILKEFEIKKAECNHEVQNLRFKLESLDCSLKELKEERGKFNTSIRYGGKHPVTKRVILQKVLKYFDDSFRCKMEMSNKLKVRIQHDTLEQNKILNQVKTKQKRLASLNVTEFQQAKFAHKNASDTLCKHKEQLAKCKSKFSPLIQDMSKLKKDLEREKIAVEKMKNAVLKQEHLKEIVLKEKARNDQKMQELEASMRKIRLDPRRHNLPQIIDYAAAKKESVALKQSIQSWQKKVARVELLSKLKKTPLSEQ